MKLLPVWPLLVRSSPHYYSSDITRRYYEMTCRCNPFSLSRQLVCFLFSCVCFFLLLRLTKAAEPPKRLQPSPLIGPPARAFLGHLYQYTTYTTCIHPCNSCCLPRVFGICLHRVVFASICSWNITAVRDMTPKTWRSVGRRLSRGWMQHEA